MYSVQCVRYPIEQAQDHVFVVLLRTPKGGDQRIRSQLPQMSSQIEEHLIPPPLSLSLYSRISHELC